MEAIRWRRLLLCGLVAGLAWALLSLGLLILVGRELVENIPGLQAPNRGLLLFALLVNLAMGTWAVWLYAAIRPRYGNGSKTAAIAGFAWWIVYCLAKANWGPFGLVSTKVLVAMLAATLPALIVVTILGARLYED